MLISNICFSTSSVFLFDDWFVIITLNSHNQLGILKGSIEVTKREHCVCWGVGCGGGGA